MPKYFINPIQSDLGIQRDGTRYGSKNYTDGQWCRFYEGSPRKIGGYELVDNGNTEIIRNLFTVPRPSSIDLYIGRASTVSYLTFDLQGNPDAEVDRTPVSGFVPDESTSWSFDLFADTTDLTVASLIVAAAPRNTNDISSAFEGPIFAAEVGLNTPLSQILDEGGAPVLCSGGIVFLSPVMVAYGNDGLIRWSPPNTIAGWLTASNIVIANTKIVTMQRTRGGGTPTLLAWTLNSVVRVSFDVANNTFSYDTVEENISIISGESVVKYNQMFFWIGTDQFYFYNGLVQKLPNTMNNDWFFNNVNLAYRSKIWGVAIPRFKEIWWFYPRGSATECNAVIIYNIESQKWYDCSLNRSAGVQTSIFPYPLFTDNETVRTLFYFPNNPEFINTYPLWMHEKGHDKVQRNNVSAIDSYFETHLFDLWSGDGTTTNHIRNRRIAPNFVQTENMTVTIKTQTYPSSPVVSDGPYPFSPTTEKIDFATQGGIVSFQFRSNVAGGFYQGGKSLYFYDIGDTLK